MYSLNIHLLENKPAYNEINNFIINSKVTNNDPSEIAHVGKAVQATTKMSWEPKLV